MDAIEMALTMAPVEIVCTVANVLVPGLGSVLNALVEIGKLCMEMKENQEMCVRVEKRFGEIFIQLQLMEKKGTLPKNDAVSRYSELLEKFYLFLKKQHKKNVILRLAAAKGVLHKIQDFHVEMDQLFKMLNLAHMDAMASWQQQWEKDKLQQQQQLQLVVGNTGQLLKELNTQRAQVEALTLLKFEVERSTDTERSSDDVALLKSAFNRVVSVSKTEVEKIPAWFLPPDDVDFDAEPFNAGSFGTVHRGIWGVGADIVVKRLKDDASSNERAKESFLKECNVWYGMNHPHVIKMFGACHVTSPPFIVCEYADNGSLDNYLSRKSTTRATTWKMLYQTSLGLEYLHSRAIVHGDLKCNNVLVVGDSAKLADFGFSFIRMRSSLMSAKPQTGATRWKAPELLMGETPSLASDIYSFGMCIIEAVTGDAPWGMVDDDTVRHLVKEGRLPPRPKEMDDHVWTLIQQLCVNDPAQRIKLKVVAGILNKIFQAEQEREFEARLESTAISEDQDVLKCTECQFVTGRGAIFCGRCGYNVRDSKPNSRGTNGSTVSNSSGAQVTPVDFSEVKSLDAEIEDVKKVQLERLVCENCFATAPVGTTLCPECGEPMSTDDADCEKEMPSDDDESDNEDGTSSDEDDNTPSDGENDSSSDDESLCGQIYEALLRDDRASRPLPKLSKEHLLSLNGTASTETGKTVMALTEWTDLVLRKKRRRCWDALKGYVVALSYDDKYAWFREQTSVLINPWEDGHLKLRVHRENILAESMEQLLGVQTEHIHMQIRIEFIDEVAVDADAVKREWFSLMERVFDETGLFKRVRVSLPAYVVNSNSAEATKDHLLYFRGAGRLLGRALLEGQPMVARLALPLLKHLLDMPILRTDLEFFDQEAYKSLKEMQKSGGVNDLNLTFSVAHSRLNGEVEVIDLKENGRNIKVTEANKDEYFNLWVCFIMHDSFAEQLEQLKTGIFEIIPQTLIQVFSHQELKLAFCGESSI